MKFKNCQRKDVRLVSKIGGHTILFRAGEEREVPEHLEDLCLQGGVVPMEDFEEALKSKEARLAAEEAEAEAERERAEAKVAEEKAALLRAASEKAEIDANQQKASAARSKATKAK